MTITHLSSWLMVAFGGLFAGGIFTLRLNGSTSGSECPSISTSSTSAGRCAGRIR
jgi:hypothetical protein